MADSITPAGQYILDGQDLWLTYGIGVRKGSEGFFRFPKRKESLSHNWRESHGTEVDLSVPTFEDRTVSLKCFLIATGDEDFWIKYQDFEAKLREPGLHTLQVAALAKTFSVYYKECSAFQRLTRIKSNKVALYFDITFVVV